MEAVDVDCVGLRVLVGGAKEGVLRYVGPLHLKPGQGDFCGVELSEPAGKHDGQVDGRRYFTAPALHGIFAPLAKVQLIPVPRTPSDEEGDEEEPEAAALNSEADATLCEPPPAHLDDSGLGTSALGGPESPSMEEPPPLSARQRRDTFDIDDADDLLADETPLDCLTSASSSSALADDDLPDLPDLHQPLALHIDGLGGDEDSAALTPTTGQPSAASTLPGPSPGQGSAHDSASPPQQENRPPNKTRVGGGTKFRPAVSPQKPPPPKPRPSLMETVMASAPPPKPKAPKPLSKAQQIQQQLKESMAKDKLKPRQPVRSKLAASLNVPREKDEGMRSRSDSGSSVDPAKKMPISSARAEDRAASRLPAKPRAPLSRPAAAKPPVRPTPKSSIPPATPLSASRNGPAKAATSSTRPSTTASKKPAASSSTAPRASPSPASPKAPGPSKAQEELNALKDQLSKAQEDLAAKDDQLSAAQKEAKSSGQALALETGRKAALAGRLASASTALEAMAVAVQRAGVQLSALRRRHSSAAAAWERERAALVDSAEEERARLTREGKAALEALEQSSGAARAGLERKAEMALSELETLSDRYSDLNQQHQKLAATMAKDADAKLQHALKELHSYKEVNQLQAGELKDFRAQVNRLQTKVDAIPGLESRIASQALELADLRAQMGRKKEVERHLSETNALLAAEKAEVEQMSTSYRMEKEELEFRLEQMSHSLDPNSSLGSPRPSDPMTSSVYGADAFNSVANNATKVLKTPSTRLGRGAEGGEAGAVKRRVPAARAPLHARPSSSDEEGGRRTNGAMADSGIGSLSDPTPPAHNHTPPPAH